MYYSRMIEKKINSIKKEYAATTIYGARQVGKSIMVDHIFGDDYPSVTLDDLIIEGPDCISPVEVKKGINPVSSNFNFNFLKKYGKPVMKGLVIDSREDLFPINENNWYLPIYMIGL